MNNKLLKEINGITDPYIFVNIPMNLFGYSSQYKDSHSYLYLYNANKIHMNSDVVLRMAKLESSKFINQFK